MSVTCRACEYDENNGSWGSPVPDGAMFALAAWADAAVEGLEPLVRSLCLRHANRFDAMREVARMMKERREP